MTWSSVQVRKHVGIIFVHSDVRASLYFTAEIKMVVVYCERKAEVH